MRIERSHLCVIGGCLVMFCIGQCAIWGSVEPYFANYFRYHGSPNLKDSQLNIVGSFQIFGLFVGQNLSAPITKKFGSRKTIFLAMLFQSALFILSSLTTNIVFFISTFAFLQTVFIGIMYMLPLATASAYFPEKKGLVMGITLCFFGFSGVFLQSAFTFIINPDNIKPEIIDKVAKYPQELIDRLPNAILIITSITAVIITIGAILMKNIKKINIQDTEYLSDYSQKKALQQDEICTNVKDSIKSRAFFIIAALCGLSHMYGAVIIYNFKIIGLQHIQDDQFFTIVGSMGSIFFGCSRPFFGYLCDKFGFKICFNIVLLLQLLFSQTLIMAANYKILYGSIVILSYAIHGACCVMFPYYTIQVFGIKHGVDIFSKVAFGGVIANFLQNFILQLKDSIGIEKVFNLLTVPIIICLILINAFNIQYKNPIKLVENSQLSQNLNLRSFN